MNGQLRLQLVTPKRQILDVDVSEVRLPAALGEIGVLPGHTPLLTSLATGPLAYTHDGTETRLAVQGGFAEILPERVTILARIADTADAIDVEAARAARAEAEEALKTASADELEAVSAALQLATTRLDVAGHTTH